MFSKSDSYHGQVGGDNPINIRAQISECVSQKVDLKCPPIATRYAALGNGLRLRARLVMFRLRLGLKAGALAWLIPAQARLL